MINLQSPGPLGLGELENSPDGNAILTLKDRDGNDVNFKLWINDFSTDLNMEIDVTQLKAGYSYRPIRIQERVLTFTTIWSLANRPKYEALVEAIREHWAYNLNELTLTPAYFTYFGANKTFAGVILNAERSYAVPDTLLSYSFNMKLMTSRVNENISDVSMYSYYIPRPDSVTVNGIDGWYAVSDLIKKPQSRETTTPATFYENLVQQREGGAYASSVYVQRDYPTPSELQLGLDNAKKFVDYGNREIAAAIVYWAVEKQGMELAQAVELATRKMKDPSPDWRDWVWQTVKQEDWTSYLDLVDISN